MAIELNNLIYVHTPKTGGTYVSTLLKNQLDGKNLLDVHDPAFLIRKTIQTDKKFFTFIRHPLSLVCSAYCHWSSAKCRQNHQNISTLSNQPWSYATFSKFWQKNIAENNLDKTIENLNSDTDMYLNSFYESYTKEVDFIGKQEQLDEDLNEILEKAGYKIRPQKKINSHSGKFKLKIKDQNVQEFFQKYNKILDKYCYNYMPKNIEVT